MVLRQLMKGSLANAFGQVVVIAIQLITPPILTNTWGVAMFGTWILLSSIPAYLSMSDLGLATTAGNDMTMRIASHDEDGARAVYHSAWLSISVCCCVIAIVGMAIAFSLPDSYLPKAVYIPHLQARITIALLFLYSCVCLQSSIQQAGFRCLGLYAEGTAINAVTMALEATGTVIIVLSGGKIMPVMIALLVTRTASVVASAVYLWSRASWLKPSIKSASLPEVRRLLHFGFITMLIPGAYTMNIQGLLLIVGLVLGPASVTTIAVTRTITRVGIQSAALLNHAVMPEFSMAAARKDRRALDQLFTINLLAYIALLAGAFVSLVVAGPFIISIWTRGAVSVDRSLIIAMAAAMVFQGLWHGTGNLLLSVSKQSSYAPHFFICNLCMIGVCYLAAKAFGIYGAAYALCLGELPMIFVVFRAMPMLGVSSPSELLTQLPVTLKTMAAEVQRRLRRTVRGRMA